MKKLIQLVFSVFLLLSSSYVCSSPLELSYQLPQQVKLETKTMKAGLPGKLFSENQMKMMWKMFIFSLLVFMLFQKSIMENKKRTVQNKNDMR